MAKSRPVRWAEACANATTAIEDAKAAVEAALEDLRDIQSEYEEWRDNLPEGLDQSPTAELLEAVVDLDLDAEPDFSEVEAVISEAEGIDLPRGFGRD